MKKFQFLYLSVLFLLQGNFSAISQVPDLDWVQTFGGSYYDIVWESAFDAQGNIINIGVFGDTVDFDPGPGQYFLEVSPVSDGGTFIQKLDAHGNFLWAKAITSTDHISGYDMEIGADGSIYITGKFGNDGVDFDPDTSKTHYINGNPNSHSMYILKLNSQGEFVWVNIQAGSIIRTLLELDTLGNIYQIGTFDGEIDQDPDPLNTIPVYPQTAGVDDFFIQKMDTAGNQLWFKAIKGAKSVQANALKLNNQQEPIIVGAFKGPVDFDPSPGTYNLNSASSNYHFSGFALHLSTSGQFKSTIALQGDNESEIHAIEIDEENNLFVAGVYRGGLVDFDPGPGITSPTTTTAGYFIEKFDSSGVMQWVLPYENNVNFTDIYPLDMILDDKEGVYLAGYFIGSLSTNPGSSSNIMVSTAGGRDGFIAKHDSSGAVDWIHNIGGTGTDRVINILKDDLGELYLSGYFSNTVNFDPYSSGNGATSNGFHECFILKFKSCPPLPAQITIDSMATLHWNDSSALPGNYNLSWYSCDGDSMFSGEHNSSFTPTQNGSYALIIERDGCQDTSDCISINNVGLDESIPRNALSLFPNPTDNILHISGLNGQLARITVVDMAGRKIREVQHQDFVNMSAVKPGTYFIIIEVDGFTEVKQVVRMRG